MTEPDRSEPASDPDFGPPVLLKRLGNPVEANLAKNKLETAGIPAFLAGENTFAGDVMHPLPYREVELFVPESLVADALEVLDAPPEDPDELLGDPFTEDPARKTSFRAFVASVVGWCFVALAPGGPFFALAAFGYAMFLGVRALAMSTEREPSTMIKCGLAFITAATGVVASVGVILTVSR